MRYLSLANISWYRSCSYALLVGGISFVGTLQAFAQPTCKPALAFTDARLSEMRLPTLQRKFTANLSVNAMQCATTSGGFEIAFSRSNENAPDAYVKERFTWHPGSVVVSVDFWADEAVNHHWLSDVEACPCR
jgi:hypothetical protein